MGEPPSPPHLVGGGGGGFGEKEKKRYQNIERIMITHLKQIQQGQKKDTF